MRLLIFDLLLHFVVQIRAASIPHFQDAALQPIYGSNVNVSVRVNVTCKQCLCEAFNFKANSSFVALNCFMNGTCQFFRQFPLRYKLQPSVGTKLYFPQNIFPNRSQCCMPNITDLLDRLKNATPVIGNLPFEPSMIGYDQMKPNETAIIGRRGGFVYWFDPLTLNIYRNSSDLNSSLSFALYDNYIYTAVDGTPAVNVFSRLTNTLVFIINHATLSTLRKYIFINNGQNMVVTSQSSQCLTFFDVHSPTNVTFQVFTIFSTLTTDQFSHLAKRPISLPWYARSHQGERNLSLRYIVGREKDCFL